MPLGLLRVIPIWAWAIAAALGWGAWQAHRATAAAAETADVHAETARLRERGMAASLTETTRRITVQSEVSKNAAATAARARADRAAADRASVRLLDHASELAASSGACDSAASGDGPADRLAHVLAESVERYREVAEAADRAVIAGGECTADYDALSLP